MNQNNMRRVSNELKRRETLEENASPNRVGQVAFELGVDLTSEEVVSISNNYKP